MSKRSDGACSTVALPRWFGWKWGGALNNVAKTIVKQPSTWRERRVRCVGELETNSRRF